MSNSSQCANCGKPVQEHFVFVESDDELEEVSHLSSSHLNSSVLSSSTLSGSTIAPTPPTLTQPQKPSHSIPPTHFHKNLTVRSDIKFQLEACLFALNNQDSERCGLVFPHVRAPTDNASSLSLPSSICPDCNSILLEELDQLLSDAEHEHQVYQQFIEQKHEPGV
jgi:hypothetical protein